MKLRAVALTGVMSLAGLGLIGAGAHAVFTTSTSSAQTITAGNLSVVLTAPGSDCPSLSDNCTLLTFPTFGPVGSSFTTGDQEVTVTNNGNIPATELIFNMTSSPPTSALESELGACVTSTGLGTNGFLVLYNGPLSGTLNQNWWQNGDTLTVGGPYTNTAAPTDNYFINIYAGPGQATACGTSPASTPTLQNDAEGESVTISANVTYQG
jgi:hypothetical protein